MRGVESVKAPDPKSRIVKELEYIASLEHGQQFIDLGAVVSKRLFELVKNRFQESSQDASIPLEGLLADDSLIYQTIESNVIAIFARVLHQIHQHREQNHYFFLEDLGQALDQVVDQRHVSLTAYFDELIELVTCIAFPEGAADLILPIEGMAVSFIRPIVWKMLQDAFKKECGSYFQHLISVQSRESLFCTLLEKIEQEMKPDISVEVSSKEISSKSNGHHSASCISSHGIEVLRKSITNFLFKYIKSISPSLYEERKEDLLLAMQPMSSKISRVLAGVGDEDLFFYLMSGSWQSISKVRAEQEIIQKIASISRDRDGLIRLVMEQIPQQATSVEEYVAAISSPGDMLKLVLRNGGQSYFMDVFAQSAVDKLQEGDWLERFLGAWFLSIRTQAHAQLFLEVVRNFLKNMAGREYKHIFN